MQTRLGISFLIIVPFVFVLILTMAPATPSASEISAMQVTAVSGRNVAQLQEDELRCMTDSGKVVRDLKRLLSGQLGCSRFQQRLFSDELGELEDDLPLRPLSRVQLVVLPLCVPDWDRQEEHGRTT